MSLGFKFRVRVRIRVNWLGLGLKSAHDVKSAVGLFGK